MKLNITLSPPNLGLVYKFLIDHQIVKKDSCFVSYAALLRYMLIFVLAIVTLCQVFRWNLSYVLKEAKCLGSLKSIKYIELDMVEIFYDWRIVNRLGNITNFEPSWDGLPWPATFLLLIFLLYVSLMSLRTWHFVAVIIKTNLLLSNAGPVNTGLHSFKDESTVHWECSMLSLWQCPNLHSFLLLKWHLLMRW